MMTPSAACIAFIDSTCVVPLENRAIPGAGRKVSSKAKGSAWPNQPGIGWATEPMMRGAAYMYAGAPGPPFRYLYPHPTAKSMSLSRTSHFTAPAACARSHTVRMR